MLYMELNTIACILNRVYTTITTTITTTVAMLCTLQHDDLSQVSFGRRPADRNQPAEDFSSAVLSFDCSFLLPFRQSFEICSTGTAAGLGDKVIRCDDFVIPRYPKQGHFDVESFSAAGAAIICACSHVVVAVWCTTVWSAQAL